VTWWTWWRRARAVSPPCPPSSSPAPGAPTQAQAARGHVGTCVQTAFMRVDILGRDSSLSPEPVCAGVGFGGIAECECWVSVSLLASLSPWYTADPLTSTCPGTGWWFCQMKTKRGWVPASFLEPLDSPDEAEDPEPNYAGVPCPPRLRVGGSGRRGPG
jgi:hypothetical protein